MRKIVVLAAIAALIAAAVGIWSTATFDGPKVADKVAGEVQATEAPGAPVSPHEIMVKTGQNPPGPILGRSVLTSRAASRCGRRRRLIGRRQAAGRARSSAAIGSGS